MTRPPIAAPPPRRAGVGLLLGLVALAPPGCARERREITPTTLGADLKAMPRGRMVPPPFPGGSLARKSARPSATGVTADPETAAASVEFPPRSRPPITLAPAD